LENLHDSEWKAQNGHAISLIFSMIVHSYVKSTKLIWYSITYVCLKRSLLKFHFI